MGKIASLKMGMSPLFDMETNQKIDQIIYFSKEKTKEWNATHI